MEDNGLVGQDSLRASRFFYRLCAILSLMFGVSCIYGRTPDSDAYFLIATGRYIWNTGKVPMTNPFVIHGDIGMVVQQPLACVANFLAYNLFGFFGLFLLGVLFYVVAMGLFWKYIRLFIDNFGVASMCFCISAVLVGSAFTSRPWGMDACVFLIELYLLECYYRHGSGDGWGYMKWLLPIPALSVLLINYHAATWPFLFILMGCYLFRYVKIRHMEWKCRLRLVCTMAISFFVGFLNVSGSRAITYLFDSYGTATGRILIAELSPVSFFSKEFFMAVVLLALIVIAIRHYGRHMDLCMFFLSAGICVMMFQHTRNYWLFILPVPMLSGSLCFKLQRYVNIPFFVDTSWQKRIERAMALVIIMLLAGHFSILELSKGMAYGAHGMRAACVNAADYLDGIENDDVVLYAGFNSGAYMELRGYRVYMDARPELYGMSITGGPDIYGECVSVMDGSMDYDAFVASYGFSHLLIDKICEKDFLVWACGQDWLHQVADDYLCTLFEVDAAGGSCVE